MKDERNVDFSFSRLRMQDHHLDTADAVVCPRIGALRSWVIPKMLFFSFLLTGKARTHHSSLILPIQRLRLLSPQVVDISKKL
jgi:hypothetical protein